MPGFSFAYMEDGSVPLRKRFPLAKSMNGTGTPPAATLKAGDIVVYTTVSALTTSSAKVVRMLLAADKTAHYEDGSTSPGKRCGILGICDNEVNTTSGAKVSAVQSNGGAILRTQGMASMNPLDSNGHAQQTFVIATPRTVFRAKLGTAAADAAAYLALKGQLAGITLSTSSGVTTYTVNTSDTLTDLCLIIEDVDPLDTTFKTVFVKVVSGGYVGYASNITQNVSYCQYDTGYPYTAQ